MSNTPKLHELLAVTTSLENQANKVRSELAATFEKKRHLFEEKLTTFTSAKEGVPSGTEAQSSLQTTILKEFSLLQPFLAKAIDAAYQVADANTRAVADIVLEDGTVLATSVPATALLELEKRAEEVRQLLVATPTLDPAKGFVPDETKGAGVFKARDVNKGRTQKTKETIVLYPATEQHPAQVQLVDIDKPVGTIQEQEWSGLITPAAKSELISRAETLARAVRAARSRANTVEVDASKKLGAKLLSFVFAGKTG
jgi:hypothetical protein